jgi:polar amino acid transport system substrate-binding protein
MLKSRAKAKHLVVSGLAAAWLLLAAAPPAWAEPRPVTLLMGEALDDAGKQKPINERQRRLLDYFERNLNIQFEIRRYPWVRAERNALEGGGLIFGLSKTPERLRHFRFSDMAAANNLWLVTRSDARFPFNTMNDLRGKTLGAVRGYSYGELFDSARNSVFRVEDDLASRELRLKRLMLGRVDAILIYQPHTEGPMEIEQNINSFMASHMAGMKVPAGVTFSVLPKPMQTDNQIYFAIAKHKDDGLIDKINAALARQRRSANLKPPSIH